MPEPGTEIYNVRQVMPSGAVMQAFACYADPIEYLDGVKYRLHYGFPDEPPIVRYDNAHGYHERHAGRKRTEFNFPGVEQLYNQFVTEVHRYERTYR